MSTMAARAHGAVLSARRSRALARISLAARLAGVDLDLSVAPTARLGRIDIRFTGPGPARLHIGAHSVIDDVELRMGGGSVEVGDWCEVRAGVRMVVGGSFVAEGENFISWGTVVHCAEAVTLGHRSSFGEYVTIADSVHEHVEGEWHIDHVSTAPVRVGVDTWVGAKATITRGVTVGDHCVVAAAAVVTRDVPDRHLAMGIPATSRALGPLRPSSS